MASMKDILIARQPIFNRNQAVVGYELLYRNCQSSLYAYREADGDQATLQVILNAFAEMGLDSIVGKGKAFINMTASFLQGKYPVPLPAERVVLEVLEDIPVDTAMVEALRNLNQRGFILALDDVTSFQKIQPFLNFIKVIKIDLPMVNHTHLPAYIQLAKQHHIRMLAEKVETVEDYVICHRLGFDFFQGYFFSKPVLIQGKKLDSSRLVLLRSLATLQDSAMDFVTLEQIIAQDAKLSYKLLRLVNTAYYSLSYSIKSLRQALSILGINQLRGWMSLLLMSSIENKPHELTLTALMRARMAEMLARALGETQAEEFFLVGLFSVLDGMMDIPMEQLLDTLPLPEEVRNALLSEQGKKGHMLRAIRHYEQGDYEELLALGLKAEIINRTYLEAVHWSNLLSQDLTSD